MICLKHRLIKLGKECPECGQGQEYINTLKKTIWSQKLEIDRLKAIQVKTKDIKK